MKEITGMMVYYYFVCKRKLWYFTNNISFENENEDVLIGKYLDENTYNNQDKHININNVINIDYIKNEKIIHEIKKSKKIEYANIMQIKYYLYYLKKYGVEDISGQIDYPLIKKCMEIELLPKDIDDLNEICGEIKEIIKMPNAPAKENKNTCKKCAYYEFCSI